MVKNAQAAQDQDGKPCIAFELTDEGALLLDAAQSALLIIDSTLEECRKRSEG